MCKSAKISANTFIRIDYQICFSVNYYIRTIDLPPRHVLSPLADILSIVFQGVGSTTTFALYSLLRHCSLFATVRVYVYIHTVSGMGNIDIEVKKCLMGAWEGLLREGQSATYWVVHGGGVCVLF